MDSHTHIATESPTSTFKSRTLYTTTISLDHLLFSAISVSFAPHVIHSKFLYTFWFLLKYIYIYICEYDITSYHRPDDLYVEQNRRSKQNNGLALICRQHTYTGLNGLTYFESAIFKHRLYLFGRKREFFSF